MNLTIGSGDVVSLMSGKDTNGFKDLMRKFLSDDKPNYNAFASPINALRTGAILEKKYLEILPDNYFCQWRETSTELDCLTVSIDFAKIESGKLVDFDELKTMHLTDFVDIIIPIGNMPPESQKEVLKKQFKQNYNQVQSQLYASGLQSANLVFLSVETYVDEENYNRIIDDSDFIKFRIERDNEVIDKLKERLSIFQMIKDYFRK